MADKRALEWQTESVLFIRIPGKILVVLEDIRWWEMF